MQEPSPIYDDPGTILDSRVRLPEKVPTAKPAEPGHAAKPAETLYRSPHRWSAPRLLVCDDDSLDQGEIRYVRSERVVIGRTQGDIVIAHDLTMSGSHAEIMRTDIGGKHGWVLRDLGSSNGTLARVRSVTLRNGMGIQLGSKRFRFDQPNPPRTDPGRSDDPGTVLVADLAALPPDMLPALVESSIRGLPDGQRHPLRKPINSIGRPAVGNDIQLEDDCVAARHAVITLDATGVWQLNSLPSLNGVWVQVPGVRLTDDCLFQCGEQRFRWKE
jgi:pSer/pThr/pTyr-binding forkhead associated (FHA) protein